MVPQGRPKELAHMGESREATLGGSYKLRSNQDAGQSQRNRARQHHPHHRQYA